MPEQDRTAAPHSPRVLVGTSGFSYPPWRGSFYPEDLPTRAMLGFYATQLGTVEINNTFYRQPSEALLAGWASQVPEGFRLALKAPQRITHHLHLREAGEPTTRFCAVARTLGERLGPLLFQLPPWDRGDAGRLEAFLGSLPAGVDAAFEFRHPSWFADATYEVLRAHGAALCIAEADDFATPFVPTAPFGYLRLRRRDYADAALDAWAQRIRDTRQWDRVHVYLKHEESGRGPALARALMAQLGAASGTPTEGARSGRRRS
jgi:uncharacterized protein YecE (DUF72 family)